MQTKSNMYYLVCVTLFLLFCCDWKLADACEADILSPLQCESLKAHVCSSRSAHLCRRTCCMCTDWTDNCQQLVATLSCQHTAIKSLCGLSCCKNSGWRAWSEWAECSESCDGGTRYRMRHCQSQNCQGDSSQTESCNEHLCPAWNGWGEWSTCSKTCSEGTRTRRRKCISGSIVSEPGLCFGQNTDTKKCMVVPCAPKLPQLAQISTRGNGPKGQDRISCTVANGNCGKTAMRCQTGYSWSSEKRACTDINECLRWNGGCDELCLNAPGSFSCSKSPLSASDQQRRCTQRYRSRYGEDRKCCLSDESDPRMESGCGINNEVDLQRIVGGEDAKLGRWPWMVRLLIGGRSLCGGTLISMKWVLTAAHCFAEHDVLQRGRVVLTVGMFNQTLKYERSRQIRVDKRIIVYPTYRFPQNDIALVEVDRAYEVTVFAGPICLPNGETPSEGKKCFSTGFGTLGFKEDLAPVLQQVSLPVVNKARCRRSYSAQGWMLRDYQFCAGDFRNGGKDSCQGDSGGPLVCQRCATCRWYIAGVTSFGHNCASPGYPGVYLSVSRFEGWIASETGMSVFKNATCRSIIEWGEWNAWTTCSKTCNTGGRTRARFCVQNGVQTNVATCKSRLGGEKTEQGRCNTGPCATWSTWGQWTACTETCGTGGIRSRQRLCLYGDAESCRGGSNVSTEVCSVRPCPSWSEWTSWEQCTVTCGLGGRRWRRRSCANGSPGDDGCRHDSTSLARSRLLNATLQSSECDVPACVTWSAWKSWGACSSSCGRGWVSRSRECNGFGDEPAERMSVSALLQATGAGIERQCPGEATQKRNCAMMPCPVWTTWSSWSQCSASCGKSEKTRSRTCLNGTDQLRCPGLTTQQNNCSFMFCPSPQCHKLALENFPNGEITCTNSSYLGSTCFFQCFSGYIMNGTAVAECNNNGDWSFDPPRCIMPEVRIARFSRETAVGSYKLPVRSLASGTAGTWMIDDVGNVYYMKGSIWDQAGSFKSGTSMEWQRVDLRGVSHCKIPNVRSPYDRQVSVEATKVTISYSNCPEVFKRQGIRFGNPIGLFWKKVEGTQISGDKNTPLDKINFLKQVVCDYSTWRLMKNGSLTVTANSNEIPSVNARPESVSMTSVDITSFSYNISDICATQRSLFAVLYNGDVMERSGITSWKIQGMGWIRLNVGVGVQRPSRKYVMSCKASLWLDNKMILTTNEEGTFTRYSTG